MFEEGISQPKASHAAWAAAASTLQMRNALPEVGSSASPEDLESCLLTHDDAAEQQRLHLTGYTILCLGMDMFAT